MPATSRTYRTIANLAVPLIPAILRDGRQREAHAARLNSAMRLLQWARQRDRSKKVAWFHAASVGEGLQAEVVINAFHRVNPDTLVVFTHYSPSALPLAARLPVDWSGYLPYDRVSDIVPVLEELRPDLLVFTKVDLWPELACQAAARGTKVAMIAATVEAESRRLRWPTRILARPGYEALAAVGAISSTDADRIAMLGCTKSNIKVTGDPRIDSVLDRLQRANITPRAPAGDELVRLIAGSTHLADEAVVLLAFELVLRPCPFATLVLVPHDPSEERLIEIERLADRLKVPQPVRLSTLPEGAPLPPFLVVDRIGVLAEWYSRGGFAYVGGGFGNRGIHSVLEPAAAARAVMIGPHDRGSRDAMLLECNGALVRVPEAKALSTLAEHWQRWLEMPAEMCRVGIAAREAILGEKGAAERTVELLNHL